MPQNEELYYHLLSAYIMDSNTFRQSDVIKQMGIGKEGFCNGLCLQYAIDVLDALGETPEDTFSAMRAKGITYFKQIAQTQAAYVKHFKKTTLGGMSSGRNLASELTMENRQLVNLLSKGKHGTLPADTVIGSSQGFARQLKNQASKFVRGTYCAIVQFTMNDFMGELSGAHSLVFICQNLIPERWVAMDPNLGILMFRTPDIERVTTNFWGFYNPNHMVVTPVI